MKGHGTRRAGAVFALAGSALLGGWILGGGGETPDTGALEPIRALSPEKVKSVQLEPGQTLGQILNGDAGLSAQEQQSALLVLQEEVNPTRLSTGTEITLRWVREGLPDGGELRGLDVEVTPDELVRLDRTELGWEKDVRETPVWADTVTVAGEITTDLWSAVVLNSDLSDLPRQDRYALIDHLDQVYQWQVDFSRQIHNGDEFRLVFERKVRPDGSMREGTILGAELITQGEPLRAIWYQLGDDEGYYELDGESVQQAFMTKPLEYRRISSGFNMNRQHPVYGDQRPHIGVDYAADTGTPVYATGDGVVTERQNRGGYGNIVSIEHSNGYETRYAHLNGFASGLSVGDRVSQGDVIGYVGMTGTATGPHLHYEMHQSGRPVDPLEVDIPSGDPIPDEEWDAWRLHRDNVLAMLEETDGPPVHTVVDLMGIPALTEGPRSSADAGSDESALHESQTGGSGVAEGQEASGI